MGGRRSGASPFGVRVHLYLYSGGGEDQVLLHHDRVRCKPGLCPPPHHHSMVASHFLRQKPPCHSLAGVETPISLLLGGLRPLQRLHRASLHTESQQSLLAALQRAVSGSGANSHESPRLLCTLRRDALNRMTNCPAGCFLPLWRPEILSRYKSSKPGSSVLAQDESFSITHLKKVCNSHNGRPLVGVRFVGANPMFLNICSRVPGQVPGPRGCQSVRCCFEAIGRCLADHSCLTAQQLMPGMSNSLRWSGGDSKLQVARPVADASTTSWSLDQPLHLVPDTGSKENSALDARNQR